MGQIQIEAVKKAVPSGSIESKILYEEADGDWLNLQGEDRKNYGKSKEMKIGIVYDGVLYQTQNGKKFAVSLIIKSHIQALNQRLISENTRKKSSHLYTTPMKLSFVLRTVTVQTGFRKIQTAECICVFDKFHRNKKITECVSDKNIAENLRELLLQNRFDELLDCIEAYINSTDDDLEKAKFQELYHYYSENKEALTSYYDRGIAIPPTRNPEAIHHARLGSMEGNVFTIIGNRMKGRRACWSISGGNNLAALLCKHYSTAIPASSETSDCDTIATPPLSAAKAPKTDGKGYEFNQKYFFFFSNGLKWLKSLSACKSLTNYNSHFVHCDDFL